MWVSMAVLALVLHFTCKFEKAKGKVNTISAGMREYRIAQSMYANPTYLIDV